MFQLCKFAKLQKLIGLTTTQLIEQIQLKKSFLCIGLDVDLTKIPQHLLQTEDPIFEFNKAIIDATHFSNCYNIIIFAKSIFI